MGKSKVLMASEGARSECSGLSAGSDSKPLMLTLTVWALLGFRLLWGTNFMTECGCMFWRSLRRNKCYCYSFAQVWVSNSSLRSFLFLTLVAKVPWRMVGWPHSSDLVRLLQLRRRSESHGSSQGDSRLVVEATFPGNSDTCLRRNFWFLTVWKVLLCVCCSLVSKKKKRNGQAWYYTRSSPLPSRTMTRTIQP